MPSINAVEKDESGQKRRYLVGVTSGIMVDGHGERMTPNCIKSFQNQAQSGDILLYEGAHGVNFVDDIGKLTNAFINAIGDWQTEYRLYDNLDGLGPATLEKADKVWRQTMGLPPYSVPRPKGFSIEGEVPEGGILQTDMSGKRVMNDVLLDGVVLVTRPAYKTSIATAVRKALDFPLSRELRKSLEETLREKIDTEDVRDQCFRKHYALQNALDEEIRRVMSLPPQAREQLLADLYAEYSELAIEEILAYPEMYESDDEGEAPSGKVYLAKSMNQESVALRQLEAALRLLVISKRSKGHGGKDDTECSGGSAGRSTGRCSPGAA
jgi:hypothetical protein